jgi:transposase
VSKGRDDKKFLSALHYFVVHNIAWRALPADFGNWNSIWKRFWRLSQSGVFEAFFEALAAMSDTPHLVQMFDSTVVRAHVSAASAKRGQDGQACAVAAGRSTDVAGHTHHRLKSMGLISSCIRM